MNVQTKY